jgi:hypothetical protein
VVRLSAHTAATLITSHDTGWAGELAERRAAERERQRPAVGEAQRLTEGAAGTPTAP